MLEPWPMVLMAALVLSGCWSQGSGTDPRQAPDAGERTGTWTGTGRDALDRGIRALDSVLARHVRGQCVDYMAMRRDGEAVDSLREAMGWFARVRPGELDAREERLALWLDAYHACLLDRILDGLGEDLGFSVDTPTARVFSAKACPVGGKVYSLDEIHQGVLLGSDTWGLVGEHVAAVGDSGDPRLHGAVYMGCRSGPPMRRGAYTPEGLSDALDRQVTRWLDQPRRGAGPEGISYLFLWYRPDFGPEPDAVESFIRRFRHGGLGGVRTDRYLPFDWGLDVWEPGRCEPGRGCVPTPETCDGLDDDCDGFIDEDLTPGKGVCPAAGVCRAGEPRCKGEAGWTCDLPDTYESPELSCDGLDNDCDGLTDEDLDPAQAGCPWTGVCATGGLPRCDGPLGWVCPEPEGYEAEEQTCDGLDNDCDGLTDEDLTPPEGLCPTFGVCEGLTPRCEAGQWVCPFPDEYEPGEEVSCDDLDNDCDGTTDELVEGCGCVNQERRDCGVDQGRCSPGIQFCWLGQWSDCSGLDPEPETCNGQDDDCDGVTDEGLPGCECSPWTRERCGPDQGRCYPGWRWCQEDGTWGPCEGGRGPTPEICDGWDDDCDGLTDEEEDLVPPRNLPCREHGICYGQTRVACRRGRWTCLYPTGFEPVERSCDGLDNDCDGLVDEDLTAPQPGSLDYPDYWDDEDCWLLGDWEGPMGCCPPRFRTSTCRGGRFRACCMFEICREGQDYDDDCDGVPDGVLCGPGAR